MYIISSVNKIALKKKKPEKNAMIFICLKCIFRSTSYQVDINFFVK